MKTPETRAADTADRSLIVRTAFGSMAAQTLRAAVRLRVVELIGDTPRRADAIAADAGAEPRPVTRLLRALAALGVLREHTPGTFSVTPAGTLLDPSRPGSLASFVRVFTDPVSTRAWEHLDDSVRTGDVAFDAVFGTDFFGHLARHPELSEAFNTAMGQATGATAAALPAAYDFGRFTSVTDVGGGDGTLLAGVLTAYPDLTGVVFDTAEGLAGAPETLERHGLTGRCSPHAGDFFRSVPAGSDLYLIKSVLHDWPDEKAATILRHCREALPPGGRILIVEPVLPDTVDPEAPVTGGGITYLSDLNMLVNVSGRERTRADFEDVCRRAGLTVVSVTPLAGAAPFSLVEAAAD
ncbi:methyltransferase [Streptomyces mobaraensis]|uniref:O-methyltransferase n=1 Tax=Streptomyces mobaraensis (strain ATCC 29032 / DSM 40847 / JCM 4168 / NBRC 13819 / NCIMB 11159 / IPCR 16-22) TaxID=1223523 RepID=M3A100_STRM1|nr:methyltransferase [Streptomyces mobaraensis]EME98738.1 O-methyltransferase [Streptomyces mobaraensis NBRC 13819 = DSM 40847]